MASEYNLEAAILATLAKFPLQIKLHHIPSHQDKKQPNILKLKWKAQLNIICDRLAGRQLDICLLELTGTQNSYCNAYVTADGDSITGQIRNLLLNATSQPPAVTTGSPTS